MRHDIHAIAELICPNTTVFDVGCGAGELLAILGEKKQVDGRGMEIDADKVAAAMARGLSVVQGDADTDLVNYPNGAFDTVVIGQSLQATKSPKETLGQCLRLGKQVIAAIPNFGHWHNRLYLSLHGKMPVTKQLPYAWYDTPNIHFCTITDFLSLCDELDANVTERYYLSSGGKATRFSGTSARANLFGQIGIFIIHSGETK